MRSVIVVTIFALVFAAGCVSHQPNPAHTECVNACRDKKNSCMIGAAKAEDVSKCEQAYTECMENCSRIPARIQVQK